MEIDDATLLTAHHHARAIGRNWTLGKLRMMAGFVSVMWLSPSGPRSKCLSSTEGLTTGCGRPKRSGAAGDGRFGAAFGRTAVRLSWFQYSDPKVSADGVVDIYFGPQIGRPGE